jgi:hypothetical protein
MSSLIDKQFGSWVVISFAGRHKQPCGVERNKWLCRCKCGVEKTHWQNSLLSFNGSRKCKQCANKEMELFDSIGELSSYAWCRVITNAKSRNHKIEINQNYAWRLFEQQKGLCAISGKRIFIPQCHENSRSCTASLDRIDSNKGYVIGNVQWVHKDINKMKNIFSMEYFIKTCKEVTAHNCGDWQ